ncbi:hypothetical protein [Afipia felis]|uniref:Uncharacterized protein n=2 Tax=Afipia felis TaxID=1035 RepID=A0A380WD67_AFIFE|nr:hypothetical protein [Afipia felis]EKS29282.1 hypothetical protein HMPREF9697_01810 [Afipia felis ATCC 53690]SUU77990.1 Uncharacterised protein [Afipia felis]SUU86055.1 Uncharacterised protein [Afipia felis]
MSERIDWQDKADYWKKRSAMHLRRYYEVAAALGLNQERDRVPHPTILARARACRAAYDVVTKEVV